MDTAFNRVAKNTGILYARMAITVFLSLYTTRLVLKSLGITDYGVYNLIAGAITMLTFLNNAMTSATQRFMSYSEGSGKLNQVKIIFNVSITLHLIIAVLVFCILETAGYFLFNGILNISPNRIDSAKIVYQFMICSTMFTIISVPYDAIINANENMLLVAIFGIVEAVFKLLIAVCIIFTSLDKLLVYGFLTALTSVILLIFHRIYCHTKYDECEIDLKSYFSKDIFKNMMHFASWSFLGSSSSIFAAYSQGIIMNIFFGPVANAAQSITNQVSGQLGALSTTMLKALSPTIIKSEGANDRFLMIEASMVGSKLSSFLSMLPFIPMLIEMPFIFEKWLGDIPLYTIIFCKLYLVRNLLDQLYTTLGMSIAAVGNIRKFQISISIVSLMPIVISYILFKLKYDAYWLYIVFLVFSLVSFTVNLYYSKKYYALSVKTYFSVVVFPVLIIFVLVYTIASIPSYMMQASFVRLFLVTVFTFISFVLLVWKVGLTSKERKMIINLLPNSVFMKKLIGGYNFDM